MPGGLDSEQLLPGFDRQVARLVSGRLQEEAVLALVHILAVFDHTEHALVDWEEQTVFAPVRYTHLKHTDVFRIRH